MKYSKKRMELTLTRKYKKTDYTIGALSIDGVYFCDTLEDTDRGLTQTMSAEEIAAVKVYGATAIPSGTYTITLGVVSPKFSKSKQYEFCGGRLPRLLNVPGFDGVLIHIGNTDEDTSGCILVGWNVVAGRVIDSGVVFRAFYRRLEAADDGICITITG